MCSSYLSPVSAWKCNYKGIAKRFIRTYSNVDEAIIQGLELSFDYDITSKLKLNSNYTYTHSEQKSGDFAGEPLNKMPKHAFNVNLDYEINKKFSVWTQYNFRGKTSDYLSRTSMSAGSPSYAFLDLGVVYKPKKDLQLGFGVYNLANKDVSDSDYNIVLEGRRFTASASVKF